jgi:hypothetical protein
MKKFKKNPSIIYEQTPNKKRMILHLKRERLNIEKERCCFV